MIEINTKEELEQIINEDNISIIQCSMEWCGTCRSIKRQIESKEQDYKNLSFYYLDLDKVDVSEEYKINELPTLISFKKGKEISRKNEAELYDWLNFLNLNW